jgi:hypothetical protein
MEISLAPLPVAGEKAKPTFAINMQHSLGPIQLYEWDYSVLSDELGPTLHYTFEADSLPEQGFIALVEAFTLFELLVQERVKETRISQVTVCVEDPVSQFQNEFIPFLKALGYNLIKTPILLGSDEDISMIKNYKPQSF